MTLKERFVGGNPQVLLLLFCLICVILICFVGICPNMIRKKKKNFGGHDHKLGTTRACGGTTVPDQTLLKPSFSRSLARPCQPISTQKPIFSLPFFPHSNITTSFIFKLLSLNLHNLNLQNSIKSNKF